MMSQTEIKEAKVAKIPRKIIGKMAKGINLTEEEKGIVRQRGKAFIPGYVKKINGVKVAVRPQLRDLPSKKNKKKRGFFRH